MSLNQSMEESGYPVDVPNPPPSFRELAALRITSDLVRHVSKTGQELTWEEVVKISVGICDKLIVELSKTK